MLNKQQIKILEIVENRLIHEEKKEASQPKEKTDDYEKPYYDGGSPGGQPANYRSKRVSQLLYETYYDADSGTKPKGGSYAYMKNDKVNAAENDGANNSNPIQEIIDAVLNNEISYKNFFTYVTNNFQSLNQPKKMAILEAILHTIDDDDEFRKIKELTGK